MSSRILFNRNYKVSRGLRRKSLSLAYRFLCKRLVYRNGM
ncbi:hypothetical protein BN135_1810 [Cronobacter muytjensii 530]